MEIVMFVVLAAAIVMLLLEVFKQNEDIENLRHSVKTLVEGNEIHDKVMAGRLVDISNKIDEIEKNSVDTYNKADTALDAGKKQIAVCWAALQNFHIRMMRVEGRVGKIYEKSISKSTEEDDKTAEELGADIDHLLEAYPMPTEEQVKEAAEELQRGLKDDESTIENID